MLTNIQVESLSHLLPEPSSAIGEYEPVFKLNNLLGVSGQLPMVNGEIRFTGKVGAEVSIKLAKEACEIATLNALSAVHKNLRGDWSNIAGLFRLIVYINTTPGFLEHAEIADSASVILKSLLGQDGVHCRSTVGVQSLPLNSCIEIELTFITDD